MKRTLTTAITLGLLLAGILNMELHVGAASAFVPNGSFESGTLGLIPDNWIMRTYNYGAEGATYVNEMQQVDSRFYEGNKSLWMHSRVVDTDGTNTMRWSRTIAETEDWINAPYATHVRIFVRDIISMHSDLGWGWGNLVQLGVNNVSLPTVPTDGVYCNGEFLNFNNYNYTATGEDGGSWYVYDYPIPESVDKTHMKIQIGCHAGDWTFYDTSYFSDLEFVVDKVELRSARVAITAVTVKAVAGQGYLAPIMVSVKNEGNSSVKFNVTAYYNETPILIEQWPEDVNWSDFWKRGDANMDGYIDNWDAYMVARAFGSSQGSSLYNPYADFNSDGFVDAFDALICAHNLGRDIWHVLGVPKLIRDYMVVGPFPLPSGNSTIINFRWNTTSVAKGKYTISAYVWPVPGDTDMTDDTFTNGMVYVGIPGDLNADGIVDVFDAVILAGAAGSRPGSSNWNPNADINSDGIVDIFDAVILSGHT